MPGPKEHNHNDTAKLGLIFRNIILGGQDGIVNVLGIVLGVATSTNSTPIVLLAGLAATFAESISMAAVAYTSSRAEAEHYDSEVKKQVEEVEKTPEKAKQDLRKIYGEKGLSGKLLDQVVAGISSNKKAWVDTMMREELRLENPAEGMSPFWQGMLVGFSAIVGSFIPITPFFFLSTSESVAPSLAASLAVLFIVGAYKSKLTSGKWLKGGVELMVIGGAAALSGYLVGVMFQVPVA
ncbi:MAG TPA: VIT1/CCC1 transporter family protein [Candidatus Bilamarchaeum sp.]|nr:VIT1/CCC1 transporter family protein [Candidatus Bilamarchaeum sp.]